MCVCVCACVRACVRVCVRACMHECVHVCRLLASFSSLWAAVIGSYREIAIAIESEAGDSLT